MTIWTPGAQDLPIFLNEGFQYGDIYNLKEAFISYVNTLYQGGYGPDTITRAYADLYLLDYYVAQVNNGGHSQFIGNSGDNVRENLTAARRGAEMIGVPELTAIIDACAEWMDQNPDEAAQQSGFGNRAAALEPLDNRLFALKFDEPAFEAELAAMPPDTEAWLGQKLRAHPQADQIIARYTDRVIAETAEFIPSVASQRAEADIAELLDWCANRSPGPKEKVDAERWNAARERVQKRLVTGLDKHWDSWSEQERRDQVALRAAQNFAPDGLYDRSIYEIRAAAWLWQHPNLRLVPQDSWRGEMDALLAASPFAEAERQARELDALERYVPTPDMMALAAAMGQARRRDGTGPLMKNMRHSYKDNTETQQRHIMTTHEGELFLIKEGPKVTVADVRKSRSFQAKWAARRAAQHFGLIDGRANAQFFTQTPSFKPGRVLGTSVPDPSVAQTMRDLHMLEALHLWTEDGGRSAGFARGALDVHEAGGRIVWRFLGKDNEILVADADGDGVRFTGGVQDRVFARAELAAWRAARQRPSGKPA